MQRILFTAILCTAGPSALFAASAVQGRLTSDGVTGRTVTGHGWTEEIIHMSAWNTTSIGGGCTTLSPPLTAGWYSIQGSFNAGEYGLFTLGFDGIPAFSVRSIALPGGSTVVDPAELRTPAHYSVMYNQSYDEWGSEPWTWGSTFYQTFTATGPTITRLATKLAGKEGDHWSMTLNFALVKADAGLPSNWTQVSPTKSWFIGGNVDPIIHIFWVGYRSSEVTLVPGQTYALKLWAAPGSQAQRFAIVARPTSLGNQYANGQLYVGDSARPQWDAYAYVSGGSDRTVVNHAPVANYELLTLVGWNTRFGQRFRASGTSLAAVEVPYATGDANPPSIDVTFQLYDGVGGNPIGPARTSRGVPGFYQGRAAASWQEGQVPLVPNRMYYLEWTTPPSGFNTWQMTENLPGEGYVDRTARSVDLMMAVAEYLQPGPTIVLSTSELTSSVERNAPVPAGSFTISNGGTDSISYSISESLSWLSCTPTSGSSSGEADTVTVNYASGLPVGDYEGTITVAAAGALNTPQTITVKLTVRPHRGDMDNDDDVDQEDFGEFQTCLSGLGIEQSDPACRWALLDGDNDVDGKDFEVFTACMGPPNVEATIGCGGGD